MPPSTRREKKLLPAPLPTEGVRRSRPVRAARRVIKSFPCLGWERKGSILGPVTFNDLTPTGATPHLAVKNPTLCIQARVMIPSKLKGESGKGKVEIVGLVLKQVGRKDGSGAGTRSGAGLVPGLPGGLIFHAAPRWL